MVGRARRCSSGSSRSRIAALIGVPLGPRRAARRRHRRGRDARVRHRLRVPGGADRDHARGRLRAARPSTAMVAIGIAYIPVFARLTRGSALQVLRSDYVLAARACGPTGRCAILDAPRAAQHRSDPDRAGDRALRRRDPRRGRALVPRPRHASADAVVGRHAQRTARATSSADTQLALWPGLAIAIAVLGFSLLGDGLRDILDPTATGLSDRDRPRGARPADRARGDRARRRRRASSSPRASASG